MKRAILLLTLSLAACSEPEQPAPESSAPAAAALPAPGRAPEALSVECAIGGGAFARVCMVDQARDQEGVTLTIRNPGGGFRRLLVTPAGEIAAADGAEAAATAPLPDGRVEVTIGADSYRIPAPSRP